MLGALWRLPARSVCSLLDFSTWREDIEGILVGELAEIGSRGQEEKWGWIEVV